MYARHLKTALIAAIVAVTPLASQATSLAPGVYTALDDIFLASEGVPRSIWTQGGNKIATGGGASNLWSFTSATFDFDGTTAKLTGSAENTGASALTFDFSLNFDTHSVGPVGGQGYCQFGGGSGGTCSGSETSATKWSYFNLVSGSFSGTGTAMDGLTYTITDHTSGVHPPQAGLEANALANNNKDGFSMWFNWSKSGAAINASTFSFNNTSGKGDINTNLDLSSSAPPVPLPAAGLLLIAALGGLLAFGRRRTA